MGYSNKTFTCPFFKWDERLCVNCEGGKMRFKDRREAEEYINRHCGELDGWRDCSMAKSKIRYYDRKDENG